MEKRKVAAEILVLTNIPGIGMCSILHVRPPFNTETNKPESYPGLCQVTAHGGAEEKDKNNLSPGQEDLRETVCREAEEELGVAFSNILRGKTLVPLNFTNTPQKLLVTYGVRVTLEEAAQIAGLSSGHFKFVTRAEASAIKNLMKDMLPPGATEEQKSELKKNGITDPAITAMFGDERDSVLKAFESFK